MSKLPRLYQSRPSCPFKSRNKFPEGSAADPQTQGSGDRQSDTLTIEPSRSSLQAGTLSSGPGEGSVPVTKALGTLNGTPSRALILSEECGKVSPGQGRPTGGRERASS